MPSLSRQLAQWVVGLRYDDLPGTVVDRAKGVTLHALASVLLGSQSPPGRQAVQLVTDEEAGVRVGATIMVNGARVTAGGAAFANAEMAFAGGKWDTFCMLTHPGTNILPGAFVAAETTGASGRDFITALAAGYEVMERLAADFIPTVMARGFHAGPVFGIFGAAVAAAKLRRFTEDQVTSVIGTEWLFLETLYRIYSTAGYNIAHIDVTASLCEERGIHPEDVERVEAEVNWLETQYPSPAFPSRREDGEARPGSTAYFTAYGVVERGFPLLRGSVEQPGADDPPAVLELMKRVTIIPSHRMTLFGPRITIYTKDGRSHTKQATGREFMWGFAEEARRIRGVVPGLPIPASQFEEIIVTCHDLDRYERADTLVRLTLKKE